MPQLTPNLIDEDARDAPNDKTRFFFMKKPKTPINDPIKKYKIVDQNEQGVSEGRPF